MEKLMSTKQNTYFHGSDLEKIEEAYGIKKEEIINFAANVNPLGISYRLKRELAAHIDAITTYPERNYASLRTAIAQYVQDDFHHIIVGNGSTELISLVIQSIRPKSALLLGPTYSEYAHELRLSGSTFRYFNLKEENDFSFIESDFTENLGMDTELLVICNPNNPTSSLISFQEMRRILEICKEKHIFVMVDETYIEFTEEPEKATAVPLIKEYQNLIILRGISKFFAAPGLRLGYGICGNANLLSKMSMYKKPWTINSLAEIAGKIMFSDRDYIEDTRKLICGERSRICKRLDAVKEFRYYPAHGNFILLRSLKKEVTSTMLFKAAIMEKMMIRDCASFDALGNQYIRFCFMK
ncbi:MAG: aminotransferase class I/II-fold pyridoxal phosphate-dependent enzyme, partial [Lachnospiraceae bacterium]|nr:aminotransferase class I/II-fold pyridoxal phosphate-dependent enzyme [Lachnospiraceae bacterium]